MATIRATCDDCGDVEMTSDDVIARVNVETGHGAYAFCCPECDMRVAKPAESRVIDLLIASGVRLDRWRLPAELQEHPLEGEPINHDDLLDFHRLLTDDRELARILGFEEPHIDEVVDPRKETVHRGGPLGLTCGRHGNVQVDAKEMRVVIDSKSGHGGFLFRCPEGAEVVARPAEQKDVELLIASGVTLEHVDEIRETMEDRFREELASRLAAEGDDPFGDINNV